MQKSGQGPNSAGSVCPARGLCPELSLHGSGWTGAAPRCCSASTLCSRVLFVPLGDLVPVKNMILVFAASGLNCCPPQGRVPECWQGFTACHDLWWRWSGTELSQPAPKEPRHWSSMTLPGHAGQSSEVREVSPEDSSGIHRTGDSLHVFSHPFPSWKKTDMRI